MRPITDAEFEAFAKHFMRLRGVTYENIFQDDRCARVNCGKVYNDILKRSRESNIRLDKDGIAIRFSIPRAQVYRDSVRAQAEG